MTLAQGVRAPTLARPCPFFSICRLQVRLRCFFPFEKGIATRCPCSQRVFLFEGADWPCVAGIRRHRLCAGGLNASRVGRVQRRVGAAWLMRADVLVCLYTPLKLKEEFAISVGTWAPG